MGSWFSSSDSKKESNTPYMNEIKHREERKLRLEKDDYDKTQQGGKRHSTRRTKKRRGTKRQVR